MPAIVRGIPQIIVSYYTRAHSMRNYNYILHIYQTRCEEKFYTVDHEC